MRSWVPVAIEPSGLRRSSTFYLRNRNSDGPYLRLGPTLTFPERSSTRPPSWCGMSRASRAAPACRRAGAAVPSTRPGPGPVASVCAALVLAAPVVVDPSALDPHLPLRFLLLSSALLVGLGARWIEVGPTRAVQQVPSPLLLGWAVLVAVACAAAVAAPLPVESLLGDAGRRFGALSVLLLFAAFVLGTVVAERLGALLRLGPVLITMIVVAMVWRSATGSLSGARMALVGNAGQLGAYLVLLLGAAAVVARHDLDPRWRRVALVTLPAGVGAVLLTGSHAAAGGAAALALAWLASGELIGSRRAARVSMGVAALAGLVVSLLWIDRFRFLADSWRGRAATWSVAWEAFLARPWLGWGPDGFRHGFAAYVPPGFVREYGDDRITDRAHTILLEPLASMGILGALAVAALLVLYLRHRRVESAIERGTARGLFGVGVFLLVWFPEVEIAAVIALLAGATTRAASRRCGPAVEPADRASAHLAAPLSLALVTALLVATGVGVGAVIVDRQVVTELEALATGQDPAANPVLPAASPVSGVNALLATVPALRASGAVPQLAAARDAVHEPRDAERMTLHAELSAALARRTGERAELRRAIDAYEHALVLAPNHSVAWLGLGEGLLLTGHDAQAAMALQRAAQLRPDDVTPRANLAIVAAARGDLVATTNWLEQACRVAPADQQLLGLIASLERRPGAVGCRPQG